jgi:glycosyltransferase involved in cell wall biosynthesis
MKKVLILYKFLPQYRVDFFNRLKDALLEHNIDLLLIYGKNQNADALKKDEVDLPWGRFVPNRKIRFGRIDFLWQPCLKYFRGQDLIIAEQANKLLVNYYLMVARKFTRYKFAYWGHGRNMQDDPYSMKNKFKFLYLKQCDWWFAYTQGVKRMLESFDYPADKITIVQNAIDTVSLQKSYKEVNEEIITGLKQELGIVGDNVGIYCGGMYPEKRLDFILEVIGKVKSEVSDFHMIFIGSGIDSGKIEIAAKNTGWIHYVGPKFGNDRVKYFKIASLQLMPGLVGLGILDSFALETPIITTEYPYHSPEIEYLSNNVNGIITKNTLEEYTNAIISLFKSKKHLQLIEECRKSAGIYTVEAMVDNFKMGIVKCLEG